MSSKCEWMWNSTYKKLYGKAKNKVEEEATMTCYIEKELPGNRHVRCARSLTDSPGHVIVRTHTIQMKCY